MKAKSKIVAQQKKSPKNFVKKIPPKKIVPKKNSPENPIKTEDYIPKLPPQNEVKTVSIPKLPPKINTSSPSSANIVENKERDGQIPKLAPPKQIQKNASLKRNIEKELPPGKIAKKAPRRRGG